jgi:hypothetical protein
MYLPFATALRFGMGRLLVTRTQSFGNRVQRLPSQPNERATDAEVESQTDSLKEFQPSHDHPAASRQRSDPSCDGGHCSDTANSAKPDRSLQSLAPH